MKLIIYISLFLYYLAIFESHSLNTSDIVRVDSLSDVHLSKYLNGKLGQILSYNNDTQSYEVQVFGSFNPIYNKTHTMTRDQLTFIQNDKMDNKQFKLHNYVLINNNESAMHGQIAEIVSILDPETRTYKAKLFKSRNKPIVNFTQDQLSFLPKFYVSFNDALSHNGTLSNQLYLPIIEGSSSKYLNSFIVINIYDTFMINEDNALAYFFGERLKILDGFPRIFSILNWCIINDWIGQQTQSQFLEAYNDLWAIGKLSVKHLDLLFNQTEMKGQFSERFIAVVKELHKDFARNTIVNCQHLGSGLYPNTDIFEANMHKYGTLMYKHKYMSHEFEKERKKFVIILFLMRNTDIYSILNTEDEDTIFTQEIEKRINHGMNRNFFFLFTNREFWNNEQIIIINYIRILLESFMIFDEQLIILNSTMKQDKRCAFCGKANVRLLRQKRAEGKGKNGSVYFCNKDCQLQQLKDSK
eukprot:499649_1